MGDADEPGKGTVRTVKHHLPHIVKDADSRIKTSSVDELYQQLRAGVFLNRRKQRYWIEEPKNCFMLYARDLSITWGNEGRYWNWVRIKEASDVSVEVAELVDVCWLEVDGKFETAKLSPGITYEVAFVVMLKYQAYGWETPVNVRLKLPNGDGVQKGQVDLSKKSRGRWIEIPVGKFCNGGVGEVEFSMYEYEGGQWKRGLVVKGVVIRPSSKVP